MGYYVRITDSGNFRINADQLDNAYKALIDLNKHDDLKRGGGGGEVWFSWMPADYSYLATTAEILEMVGFAFTQEKDGSLSEFEYDNKQGCEDVFLAALAPFIEDGCWMNWYGEDGEMWRYTFSGGVMRVHSSEVVYAEEGHPLIVNKYSHDDDGKFTVTPITVADLIHGTEVK